MRIIQVMRWLFRGLWLALRVLIGVVVVLVVGMVIFRPTYPFGSGWNAVARAVEDHHFDYVTWEIDALLAKAEQVLFGVGPFIEEGDRSQLVRDYMADMTQVRQLEGQIEAIFIDPAVEDPAAASELLRQQRDTLRADLSQRQSLIESILEGQVAAVLAEDGFGVMGQLTPPIAMRFTRMPQLLVTSPRDRIFRDSELAINPLPLEEITAIEDRLQAEENLSALVVPLGGMALYPAMIAESSNLAWAVETFAHEWVHQYFFFYPLGLNYFIDTGAGNREALIINETVADIFGAEVAQRVLRRYYPETVAGTDADNRVILAQDGEPFDYGVAMNETRVTVDGYMATIQNLYTIADDFAGRGWVEKADQVRKNVAVYVNKAERYMEQRREVFYANGYNIRRMNQAYFAFYGGYQGGIPGIGGEDPIGPAVRDLRAASDSLHDFVVLLRDVTSRQELLALRDRVAAAID